MIWAPILVSSGAWHASFILHLHHVWVIYHLRSIFDAVKSWARVSGGGSAKESQVKQLAWVEGHDCVGFRFQGSLYDIGSYEELQSRGVDIREFVTSDLSQNSRRGQLEAEEENFRVRVGLLFSLSWLGFYLESWFAVSGEKLHSLCVLL